MLNRHLDHVKRIWYLSPMRAVKVQASLRIYAVSPEPSLLAHTSSESRGTFRQKAKSLASLNGWACAVKTCYDGMLEDTNSLDGAHFFILFPDMSCWGRYYSLCFWKETKRPIIWAPSSEFVSSSILSWRGPYNERQKSCTTKKIIIFRIWK